MTTIACAMPRVAESCVPPSTAEIDLTTPGSIIYVEAAFANVVRGPFADVERYLYEAGYAGEVLEFSWVTGLGILADHLLPQPQKREHAARLAALIEDRLRDSPDRPIDLVSFSAGAAVLLYAVEQAPVDSVRNVVLLSPSISDEFDLSPAAARLTGRLAVVTSPIDMTLMVSNLLGTSDGVYCGICAMGLNGPRLPLRADAELGRTGVACELRWNPDYASTGHNGLHTGLFAQEFFTQKVMPLLLAPQVSRGAEG